MPLSAEPAADDLAEGSAFFSSSEVLASFSESVFAEASEEDFSESVFAEASEGDFFESVLDDFVSEVSLAEESDVSVPLAGLSEVD